jgi:hypothetical protein
VVKTDLGKVVAEALARNQFIVAKGVRVWGNIFARPSE